MKTARDKKQLNRKEGTDDGEGSLDPSKSNECHEDLPKGGSGGIETNLTDSLLESGPISMMVWHGEHS